MGVSEPLADGLCRILLRGVPLVAIASRDGVVPTRLGSPFDVLVDGAIDPTALRLAATGEAPIDPAEVVFLPPVAPRTMLYCGRNYEDHLAENPRPRQADPVFFSKLLSSLVGHRQPVVVRPDQSVDYEGELAVVIGRPARGVAAADALSYVAGYTIANDVSDRAVQHVNHQITMGKGPDTFGPLGPVLVPRSAIGDGNGLRLRTWVNDDLRQDGTTSDLIHDVVQCIVAATRTVTLLPGDVIATGTPAGVGAYMDPPGFMRPGDVVRVAIDGLGTLVNPVVAETR
jgi:5-carboxymethyl-2-hydroxymuconate isomerase